MTIMDDGGRFWGPPEIIKKFTLPDHDPSICPFCQAGVPLAKKVKLKEISREQS